MFTLLLMLPVAHAEIVAVGHEGQVRGDAVEWTTTVVVDAPLEHLDLVVPLPPDAELLPQAGTAIERDGRIVGFGFSPAVTQAVLRVREPLHPDDGRLAAPMVRTSAVQRLVVEGGSFQPDASADFGRTLDDLRQVGIDHDAAQRVDRQLRVRARHPAYFVADDRVRAAGGLAGTVRVNGTNTSALWVVAAGGLLVVLGALAAAWRSLAGLARAEEVDAYMRDEFVSPGKRAAPAPDPTP